MPTQLQYQIEKEPIKFKVTKHLAMLHTFSVLVICIAKQNNKKNDNLFESALDTKVMKQRLLESMYEMPTHIKRPRIIIDYSVLS